MHLDVQDLRNFYYRGTLGRAAQMSIRTRLTELWPDTHGQTVLGFGFAVPLLRPYLAGSRRVIALMPGPQGVMPWPSGQPNVAVLAEEAAWPIETGHVDRLIMLHGLETSEQPSAVLDECARVLGPGGRALFIVPNRAGLWSRSDATPFGFGRPYTLGQLDAQLRRHGFVPERHRAALFQPPTKRRFWLRSAPLMERLGSMSPTVLAGGVFMVEATKRAQPKRGTPVKEKVMSPLDVLEGMTEPVPKPA